MKLFEKIGKIVLASFLFISSIPFTFAQATPDLFQIDISPSTFDINTPVDVTIKAVTANWEVIKDYVGDVFLDINLDTADYTVPSEGLYSFVAQDQGTKTFSKWLIVKKAWTYTFSASDVNEDTIKWEKSITVWWWTDSHNSESWDWTVSISSPTADSTIKSDVAEIIWSGSIKNSPFEILLNWDSAYKWSTDEKGGFVWYINDLKEWKNTIQARILNITDDVVASSSEISFTYQSATDSTFNSIQILPSNKIKVWEKATFKIKTSETVSSAVIKFSNGRTAPMDMETEWSWTKDITIDTAWKLNVSLDITTDWKTKTYSNISILLVEQSTSIGKVRLFSDSAYKNKLTITRDILWNDAPKYLVEYWTNQDTLNESQTVTTKELILENLTPKTKYYFQVSALDTDGNKIWTASEVVNATIGDENAPSCTVQWIKVNDIIEWNMHYLSRSGVQNTEKYIIYRSDTQTTIENMQKVWETTDTKFEYPFNAQAKEEKYSYYAIQAICKDGKAILIDDMKKVKTGPMENILLFTFITLFCYASYKLYGINND